MFCQNLLWPGAAPRLFLRQSDLGTGPERGDIDADFGSPSAGNDRIRHDHHSILSSPIMIHHFRFLFETATHYLYTYLSSIIAIMEILDRGEDGWSDPLNKQADRKLQRNSFSHLAEFDEGVSLQNLPPKKTSRLVAFLTIPFAISCIFIIFIHFYHNFGEAIVVYTFWKMPGIGGQDMHHMLDLLWACRSYSFWVSPSGQAAWTRTSKDIPSSINGLPLDQAHLADSCRWFMVANAVFRCHKNMMCDFLGGARCTWASMNDGWTLC